MAENKFFTIIEDPLPSDIAWELTFLSNNMARLERLVAQYKREVAQKKTALERVEAMAWIRWRSEKNQALIRARVSVDEDVMAAQIALEDAENVFTLAQAELNGYDAQFVAVRKQAELKKMEMKEGL
jgi:hypothetical protein